jgi:hypothetical protein
MPYSAPALEERSLRLRSRRERSDRPPHVSVWLVVAVLVIVSLVGFIGVNASGAGPHLPALIIPSAR